MKRVQVAWVVAAVITLSASGFAFHFPGSYGEPTFDTASAIFGLILGAVNGAAVGLFMGLAIRAPKAVVGRLTIAMAIAIGATHGTFDGSSTTLPPAFYALLAGLLVAAGFALCCEERAPLSMAVIGLAWGLGIWSAGLVGNALGLPREATPIGWAIDHATDGAVTGLVWGIATAANGLPSRLRLRSRTGIHPFPNATKPDPGLP